MRKHLPGGEHNVADLGKTFDSCIDAAVFTKELASMYGIEGSVTRVPYKIHYHWQEATENGEGRIVDSFWLRQTMGFARNYEHFFQNKQEQP